MRLTPHVFPVGAKPIVHWWAMMSVTLLATTLVPSAHPPSSRPSKRRLHSSTPRWLRVSWKTPVAPSP